MKVINIGYISILILFFVLAILMSTHMSQLTTDSHDNIETIKKLAYAEYPNNKILADLTICQAILESNLSGYPSKLALEYRNLFGQKPGFIKEGTNGIVKLMTTEYVGGRAIKVQQPFLYNANIEDSLQQHKVLLELDRYKPVRESKTFEEAATNIRLCGYATAPDYTKLLIKIYHEYIK